MAFSSALILHQNWKIPEGKKPAFIKISSKLSVLSETFLKMTTMLLSVYKNAFIQFKSLLIEKCPPKQWLPPPCNDLGQADYSNYVKFHVLDTYHGVNTLSYYKLKQLEPKCNIYSLALTCIFSQHKLILFCPNDM